MEQENNRKTFVSRVLVIAIALAMVIPAGLTLAGTYDTETVDAIADTEYVIIQLDRTEDATDLPSNIKVVEEYDSFVMAEITSEQKVQLQRGRQVETMKSRTTFNFNGYSHDVMKGNSPISENLRTQEARYYDYYFVKFIGPVKQEWQDDVERNGGKIYGPADSYTALVGMNTDSLEVIKNLDSVMWVGNFEPGYKISQVFDGKSGEQPVTIYTFPEKQSYVNSEVAKLLAKSGKGKFFDDYAMPTHIAGETMGYIRANFDTSLLGDIAQIDGVLRIEYFDQPKNYNDMSHSITQSGTALVYTGAPDPLNDNYNVVDTTTPVWNQGIYGQDDGTGNPVVFGCSDSGIRVDHLMFQNDGTTYDNDDIPLNTVISHRKIVRYMTDDAAENDHYADGSNDHGTHVIGTVIGYDDPVGGSNADDGTAPGAKVSFFDIGNEITMDPQYVYPPADYYTTWQPSKDDGARAYTQSWGSDSQGIYTGDAQMIDQWVYDNPEWLFTWSAGNSGPSSGTIGQQAESKNTISIGSCGHDAMSVNQRRQQNIEEVSAFSSRGPTFDNRIKPDVMASGQRVDSAQSSSTTLSVSFDGTSMAAPNAIAAILLCNQYFMTGFYPTGAEVAGNEFDPSHSLIKALLVNGADEMTGLGAHNIQYDIGNGNMAYPNPDQGFGRINLDNSLYFSTPTEDARKLQVFDGDNGVETGRTVEYKYWVEDNAQDLRVTICWNDYPAIAGSSVALVNDLDLEVEVNGNIYYGNVFSGTPGYSVPVTTETNDRVNNIEHIKIATGGLPASGGEVVVRVTGYDVDFAPQPFAIVLTGSLDLDYGTIQLDQDLYGVNQVANIIVEDSGKVGAGTLAVDVSSAGSGDSESITLTEGGAGTFEGTVEFTLNGADPAGNGILAVTGDDDITAAYDDTTGNPHMAYAYASIDGYGPVITNVRTELTTISSAQVAWDLSEQGNATVYYGTVPASLSQKEVMDTPYTTSALVTVSGMTGGTLYYYDVESTDLHGNVVRDDNGGDHYTFTTGSKGDILVVMNGAPPDYERGLSSLAYVRDCYEWSLTQLGWSYNIWPTWLDGDPSLATLQSYKIVMWQIGSNYYPPFSANQQSIVKDYNDGGGRIWASGHDIAWGMASGGNGDAATDSWLASQMNTNWVNDYAEANELVGVASDLISGDYTGGITLEVMDAGGAGDEITAVPSGYTTSNVWFLNGINYLMNNAGIKAVSTAANDSVGGDDPAIVWDGTNTRKVINCFEWTAVGGGYVVETAIRSEVLDKGITWLLGSHDHPDVSIIQPDGGETIVTDTYNVQWDVTTYGAGVLSQEMFYSPNAGDAWFPATTVAPIGIADRDADWDVSALENGVNYLIKMVVTDDLAPYLVGSDESDAVFSINRPGGDTQGPVVQAGSIRVEPNPVDQFTNVWFNATIDDSNKGGSAIAEAEYFIDSVGSDGFGTALDPADGAFNLAVEDVTLNGGTSATWSIGEHTLYIHGRDAQGNWGSYDSTTFTINDAGGEPQFGYDIDTSGYSVGEWAFVSFAYVMNGNIETVLTDFSGGGTTWDIAKWYNPLDASNPWKTYSVNSPSLSDMPQINQNMGVWLHLTANDGTLTTSSVGDYSAVPVDVTLNPGWNLVGYPSVTGENAADSLLGLGVNWIGEYQAATPYINDESDLTQVDMSEGNAYWIHVDALTTWTVNP